MSVNTASYSKISIKMANDHNPACSSAMQVFWSNGEAFSETNSAWAEVSYQGGWATYTINLAGRPCWSGTVSKIRIDPIIYGDGHAIGVDSIILTP
ncbi:hypothetical protein KAI87_11075, partial [Myxococcota bacterium]|nr:hypothetical protein [Myxococcota bacterium]